MRFRLNNWIFYSHGLFSPDSEIASAWDSLIKGDFTPNDIKLLEHEYFESKFEKIFKVTYREAHDVTVRTKERGYLDRDWRPL